MTPQQPQASAADQKLQALGEALIQPATIPNGWPKDFFHHTMDFGSTAGMTNGAKSKAFRHRALYSTLRASAYEKVLSACLARTRVARTVCFLFALVWGVAMLAFNYSKVGELKASVGTLASVVPGLGAPMTPEQAQAAQMEALRKQFGE
jgi:outer membrane murein-binding lipoprotein Lpp